MNKVIVAGSINMDIVTTTKSHPKIGETVIGTSLNYFPGGKGANQAVASAKLGQETYLIGKVGNDSFGQTLKTFLEENKVNTTFVSNSSEQPTGTAIITVANSDNTIVIVPGANNLLASDDLGNIQIEEDDVLISQFEIQASTIEAFFEKGKVKKAITILNPTPTKEYSNKLRSLSDYIIVNETELAFYSGEDTSNETNLISALKRIRLSENQSIILTLGEKGIIALAGNEVIKISGLKVEAVDTTGAGDCFIGAFSSQLAKGTLVKKALEFANKAAAISVTRKGAGPSMPTLKEVDDYE
jgi:ribokinase